MKTPTIIEEKIEDSTPIDKGGRPPAFFDRNVLVYLPPPCFFFL
jgi:hypothetical protein